MKRYFTKPYAWAICFSILLSATFAFVLLDTFVIPKSISSTEIKQSKSSENISSQDNAQSDSLNAVITDSSYEDENIKISIEEERNSDTTFYVADIQVSDPSYLKTALAKGTYGRNIKETTSEIAESNHAILAINGDYYGFRDEGYVVRNGVLYRDALRANEESDDLLIDNEGDFSIISESQTDISSIDLTKVMQILSFGPSLVEDGLIKVDSSSEVAKSMRSNPRTAIGQISDLHYIIIVSDGRTEESEGLSLLELAEEMQERGAITAYNLDGGGSSTLYFNGKVVNNPTSGRSKKEREVSDIVYFGYE